MKKFFAIFVAICMLVGVLCITAFAEEAPKDELPEPAAGTVLRTTASKGDDIVLVGDYTSFEDGWNAAMKIAGNKSEMKKNGYDRIVVDIYTDWTAKDGNFTSDAWWEKNGDGFDNDTIYIPADARVTLNLNGYTINRGLTKDINDGEVIFINDDADVIINNGTITGGNSNSEGGGLYIEGGANVTLNNVHIVGNYVYNDDGAGIYMYGGSTLTMNGGSIANNMMTCMNVNLVYGGGIYIEESTANFKNVTFQNNHSGGRPVYTRDKTETYHSYGAAIYADESIVNIDTCYFYDNGHHRGNFLDTYCVISVKNDSEMTIKNTIFTGNGGAQHFTNGHSSVYIDTKLFYTNDSDLTIENCQFVKNNASILLEMTRTSYLNVSDTSFTDNNATIYSGSVASSATSSFVNCTFDRNYTSGYSFEFAEGGNHPTFEDCNFGNSSFNNRSRATIVDTDAPDGAGSIFGAGSLTMVIALLALIASGVCLVLIVDMKKKLVSTAVSGDVETEE